MNSSQEASAALGDLEGLRKKAIPVVVVDDQEDDRALMRDILNQSPGLVCAGCHASSHEALSSIPQSGGKIVLMDIRMPEMSGIECTRRLKSVVPDLIVILVSGLTDDDAMSQAFEAGGDAYLVKPFLVAQFLSVIRFSLRKLRNFGEQKKTVIELLPLTSRETEIMQCLNQGLYYKEIADKLHISFSAVHKHTHKIYLKLHVGNRIEAINKWRAVACGQDATG